MLADNRSGGAASAATQAPAPAQNLAEMLHDLGVVLRRGARGAVGTAHLARSLQSLRWESRLALRFVNLAASVQFRAMVEDWPLQGIEEAVGPGPLEAPRHQTGTPGTVEPRTVADAGKKRAERQGPGFPFWLAVWGVALGLAAGIVGGLR